jgi:DNA-binding transcriptional regulator YdaS (Cro superfamily)
MRSQALSDAILEAGSVSRLARAIGVTPQAVSQWHDPPANRVLAIERATGVSRHRLRPDIYPLAQPRKAVQQPSPTTAHPQHNKAA